MKSSIAKPIIAGALAIVVAVAAVFAAWEIGDARKLRDARLVSCDALPQQREGQRVRLIVRRTERGVACASDEYRVQWLSAPADAVALIEATWRGGELVDARPAEP